MGEGSWRTSVDELVSTFRSTVRGLVPSLQQVRIPIGVRPGVDAWDDITEVLFKHFVVEPIRWSLPEAEMEGFGLPCYEMDYENYSEFRGLLRVEAPTLDGRSNGDVLVFHSFAVSSRRRDLSTVVACPVGEDWSRGGHLVELEYERCEFRCLVKRLNGAVDELAAIQVSL